jgi:hypothetical protein
MITTCRTALLATLLVAPAAADTLFVPGDAANVQAAVDLALDGDEIVIGPGTWIGDVDLSGRSLVLRSSHGAEATILAGSGSGSVVTMLVAPGVSEIHDVTITGGTGSDLWGQIVGGGVLVAGEDLSIVENPQLTLSGCVVESAIAGWSASNGLRGTAR